MIFLKLIITKIILTSNHHLSTLIHYPNIGEIFSNVVQVNENYLKLKAGYLFPEIAKRVKIFSQSNKGAEIIKLGIGDVTPIT